MNLGAEIAKWVNEEAFFLNRSAVCRAAKIDRANFDKFIKSGGVPEKHIPALLTVLTKYGFNKILEKVVSENNKPENKKQIISEREGSKVQDLINPTTEVKPSEQPKSNYVETVEPNVQDKISEYETEMANLTSDGVVARQRRKWLQNKIWQLKGIVK